MRLVQLAISSTHLRRSHDWYCSALGFVPAGQPRHREVPGRGLVSGLPEAALDVWWLLGADDWLQIEMFEFQRPRMRTRKRRAVNEIGYSTIGLHVADFDAAIERLRRTSGRLLTRALGPRGGRRVCLRDPDNILIELVERDFIPTARRARPETPVRLNFVTISVHDLERAARFWCDGLGLHLLPLTLHDDEHEDLWGLAGSTANRVVVDAGHCYIELTQYERPTPRWRPAGYLFSDQGILNVALGTSDRDDFVATYRSALEHGYKATSEPYTENGASVVYLTDHDGISVELLYVSPGAMEEIGFVPTDRCHPVRNEVAAASAATVDRRANE